MALSERLPEHIATRIYESIGEASMCWENVDKAGIFASTMAAGVAERLCDYIADEMDKLKINKGL